MCSFWQIWNKFGRMFSKRVFICKVSLLNLLPAAKICGECASFHEVLFSLLERTNGKSKVLVPINQWQKCVLNLKKGIFILKESERNWRKWNNESFPTMLKESFPKKSCLNNNGKHNNPNLQFGWSNEQKDDVDKGKCESMPLGMTNSWMFQNVSRMSTQMLNLQHTI